MSGTAGQEYSCNCVFLRVAAAVARSLLQTSCCVLHCFSSRQLIPTMKQGRPHQPWYGCIAKSHGSIGVCEYTRPFSCPCPSLGRPCLTAEPVLLDISAITLPPPPLPAATWFLLERTAFGRDPPAPPPPVPPAPAAVVWAAAALAAAAAAWLSRRPGCAQRSRWASRNGGHATSSHTCPQASSSAAFGP